MGKKKITISTEIDELRLHLSRSHEEWAVLADEIDDAHLPSYHRADHLYAGADKTHKHPEIHK